MLKHKSKIKGKENSETEFYYEVELESNFKKNKKLSAQLNPNELLDSKDKKNLELFKKFQPSASFPWVRLVCRFPWSSPP